MRAESRGARHRSRRRGKHFLRDVEAEETRLRVSARKLDEVAPGAAADLEHVVAGRGAKAGDRLVTAEKIEFAAQVIDMPLPAIHLIHQSGGVARFFRPL